MGRLGEQTLATPLLGQVISETRRSPTTSCASASTTAWGGAPTDQRRLPQSQGALASQAGAPFACASGSAHGVQPDLSAGPPALPAKT